MPRPMRALPAAVAALALLSGLAACADAAGPADDIAGSYLLRSVDGNPVPTTILEFGDERVEILSGSIRINADGTFRSSITRRDWIGQTSSTVTQTDDGVWGRTGNRITLTFPDGDRDAAVIDGATLTVNSAGFVFAFVRSG